MSAGGPPPIPAGEKRRQSQPLSQREQKQSLTKYDLLRLYRERVRSAPYGTKAAAREDFVAAYNTGLLYPQLFQALGPVSWKTLEGWKRDVKCAGNDCFVLADRRGSWKRGLSLIGEAHAKILLACLLHPNRPKIAESIRFAREIMAERGISNGFRKRPIADGSTPGASATTTSGHSPARAGRPGTTAARCRASAIMT